MIGHAVTHKETSYTELGLTNEKQEEREVAAGRRISRAKKKQEEERYRKLIAQLECDNKNILDNMRHSEEQDYDLIVRRRECILALAENYERLHELGEYKEPVDTICATICNLVREHGLFVTEDWIHDVLPKKYKLPMLFLSLYNVHELREILPPLVPSLPVPTAIEEQKGRFLLYTHQNREVKVGRTES
jgi:hypothetical protein